MIRSNWWKILAVILMLYVITAGLLIPLKPGILNVSVNVLDAGANKTIIVESYNSNFKKAEQISAWLKLDDTNFLKAKSQEPLSENRLKLAFDIPSNLPLDTNYISVSLILDNDFDGPSVLPDAVTLRMNRGVNNLIYVNSSVEDIHHIKNFKFPYRNILIETIRNTFFHVAIWMAMFVILTTSLIYSIRYLSSKSLIYDMKASAFAEVGIVFGMIGLATGSVWAKATWGAYWTTDIKLNMSAISMLIYIAYWILRGSIGSIDSRARISSVYNIFAYFLMIPLLLILPRMTDSLHPGNGGNPALGGEDLDNTLRMVFYPAILALTLLGTWLAQLSYRVKSLELDPE